MLKKITALALAAVAALSFAAVPALATETVHAEIIADGLRVRSGPSVEHGRLTSLDRGDAARVLAQKGRWLKIQTDDGVTGWIYGKYAQITIGTDDELLDDVRMPDVEIEYTAHIVRADGWNDYTPIEPAFISNKQRLEEFTAEARTKEGYEGNFKNALELLDGFELEYSSLIVFSVCSGSGSVRYDVERLYRRDNVIHAAVSVEKPEIGTDDMAEWLVLIEVKNTENNGEKIVADMIETGAKTAKIELESNPTTGYGWTYTADADGIVIEVVNRYDTAPGSEMMMGAGGTHTFEFAGVNQGKATLTFTYSRPWEDNAPEQTLVYELNVDASMNVECELVK